MSVRAAFPSDSFLLKEGKQLYRFFPGILPAVFPYIHSRLCRDLHPFCFQQKALLPRLLKSARAGQKALGVHDPVGGNVSQLSVAEGESHLSGMPGLLTAKRNLSVSGHLSIGNPFAYCCNPAVNIHTSSFPFFIFSSEFLRSNLFLRHRIDTNSRYDRTQIDEQLTISPLIRNRKRPRFSGGRFLLCLWKLSFRQP